MSYARAKATDPVVIEKYFDILENTLVENDIMDKPFQIFNADETGMPLSLKTVKVVDRFGGKNPSHVTGNNREQITVLACGNASGSCIPPFVIFRRKKLNPDVTKYEVPGTMYGLSSSGWMDQELFSDWFSHHFLAYAPSARPLLLLMDGHSTHYCPRMIARAAEEKVLLFTLPPNTTHLCQPLDKSGFSPLKVKWKEVCHRFLTRNPGKVITLYSFSELFSEAWQASMGMKTISNGFKVTGIYPFNRNCLSESGKFTSFNPKSLPERSGLAYIPLYSPAKVTRLKPVTTSHVPPSSTPRVRRSFSFPSLNNVSDDSLHIDVSECVEPMNNFPDDMQFSVAELALFTKRFENGFDVKTDKRYNLWLSITHSKSQSKLNEVLVAFTNLALWQLLMHSPSSACLYTNFF